MRYTLVEEMRETLTLIETELATFCQNIESAQLLAARVFTLPPIAKSEELDRVFPPPANSQRRRTRPNTRHQGCTAYWPPSPSACITTFFPPLFTTTI